MRKQIAKLASVAMLASMALSNGASAASIVLDDLTIAGSPSIITVDLPAGVDLAIGDTVTLTVTDASDGSAVDLSAGLAPTALSVGGSNEFAQIDVTSAAQGIITTDPMVGDPAGGGTVILTLGGDLTTDTAYTVSYTDSDGNYSAGMVNLGTANTVSITARVVPTLTFSVTSGDLDFGDLSTAAYRGGVVTMDYATNAASGLTVDMSTTGLSAATADAEIGQNDIDGAKTQGFGYYKYSYNAGADGTNFSDDTDGDASTAQGAFMTAPAMEVASEAGPVAAPTGSGQVAVGAKIDGVTPADTYADTLTFVATATF